MTVYHSPFRYSLKRGFFVSADLLRIRASRVEPAARWWLDQVRDIPWDDRKPLASHGHAWNRCYECFTIRMLWAKENLFDCSCLAHLPRIHDCYSIACVCDDAHVMCNQNHCHVQLLL